MWQSVSDTGAKFIRNMFKNRLNYESYDFVLGLGVVVMFLFFFICILLFVKKKEKEHLELLVFSLIYYVTQNPRHWLAELVLGDLNILQ